MAQTKLSALNEARAKEEKEIRDACADSRIKLEEMGFIVDQAKERFTRASVFKSVFNNLYVYNINDLRLMSCDLDSLGAYMLQFMVTFEDNETTFVYLKADE